MPTCGQCGTIEEDRAARYCRSCGTALSLSQVPPELQRIDLRGTVTVVRCDIVDSTPLVERHDPELVRRILTTYSDTARQTVARSGGMLARCAPPSSCASASAVSASGCSATGSPWGSGSRSTPARSSPAGTTPASWCSPATS